MALTPAARRKLGTVGSAALAAVLARRGLPDRRIEDVQPLSPTQDALVGEASGTIETCRAGSVLVVEAGLPLPPLALLVRRSVAGIVSAAPLRQAGEIVRCGIPAFQCAPGRATRLAIADGDIVVGDRGGVIVLPASLANEIADEAAEAIAFAEFIAEQVSQGGGVYGLHIPSGDRAKIAFAAWRKMKGR